MACSACQQKNNISIPKVFVTPKLVESGCPKPEYFYTLENLLYCMKSTHNYFGITNEGQVNTILGKLGTMNVNNNFCLHAQAVSTFYDKVKDVQCTLQQ